MNELDVRQSTEIQGFIPEGFELTRAGIKIPETATFEQVERIWDLFEQIDAVSNWVRGDILRFSEAKHGEKYSQLLDEDKENYQALRNCKWVSEKFDLSTRVDKPWSYYRLAASLDTDIAIDLIEQANSYRELVGLVKNEKHGEVMAIPLLSGKYRTIVIDPPWEMQKIAREVAPEQVGFDYPTMSIEDIKAFNICADEYCHLYCWTTQKYLPETFEILKAWDFTYIFTMTWHKNGGFQPFGLPQYNSEFVVFGRRGGLVFDETKAFNTCFSADRREHSRKPDKFYELVRRVSPGPRIDIFSRELRDGFDQYGNQEDKFNVSLS